MMKEAALVMVLCAGSAALAEARAGLRPAAPRSLSSDKKYEEVFFSEMLYGDETVVVLEDGPFKFTASCKTVDYDYSHYYSSSSYVSRPSSYSDYDGYSDNNSSHSTYTYSSSSTHYYPHTSSGCYNPCSSSSSSYTSSYSPCSTTSSGTSYPSSDTTEDYDTPAPADVGMYSSPTSTSGSPSFSSTAHSPRCNPTTTDHSSTFTTSTYPSDSYMPDYYYSESFAALELTYTAEKADYVYGSPSYSTYPNETTLVGAYEAGESRTQTVFAGRDGGWGDDSTLSSTSGHYVTINGDKTIGIHKDWTEYLPGGNSSFPDGVDCMISGFITYVNPDN